MNADMIQITSVHEETEHTHSSAELLYVLKGYIEITILGEVYKASPRDVIMIDPETSHSWKRRGKALVCKVYMDYYALKNVLKREHISFLCNSVKEPEKDYARIRYILEIILRKYAEEPDGFWVKSLYYSLWETLKTQYLDKTERIDNFAAAGKKAKEVTEFIHQHYDQPLNLTGMAERWYMSESAFSRFFKRETGIGFTEYVRNVRLERAKEELMHTNLSVTDISYDCGFSNISVFNKSFKQAFNLTPKEFRQKKKNIVARDKNSEMTELTAYLKEKESEGNVSMTDKKKVKIDVRNGAAFHESALVCMNAGMMADLLEARVQQHVFLAARNLGVRYIRVLNPFDPALKLRSGHETQHINFEKLDSVLDFLVEQNVIPVLELPERKKKMIVNIGSGKTLEKQISEPVFDSFEEWVQALDALMEHLTERYTVKEVCKWIFEIWYDVEQITGAGQIPYKLLYESSHAIIRRYAPEAKIGGNGINPCMGTEILKDHLLWWKDRVDRPDFLTFISYPYQVEFREKNDAGIQYNLLSIDSDSHFLRRDLESYYKLLRQIDYPKTPVWVSEWNTSLSERNIYNDSCAKACHILTQMLDIAGKVERMSYYSISDCPSQSFDSGAPLIGATGLITRDGVCKPVYYAMEFWELLGDKLLAKGEHYIVTSQNKDAYQILAFNAKEFSYSYHMKEEDQLQAQELPFIFRNSDNLELSFEFRNIREGKHKICIHRVCETSGNVLAEWGKLGYAQELLRSEISYLKKICIPRMEVYYQEVEDDMLRLDVKLEANEIALIQIW